MGGLTMLMLFSLYAVPMGTISFLAIESNDIAVGIIGLIGTCISVLGTVYIARLSNKTQTDRLLAAMEKSDIAQLEAAIKLRAETAKAAKVVAEAILPVDKETPMPVEIVPNEAAPLPVKVVEKEDK